MTFFNNRSRKIKKIFFLACLGNVLEFYDFSIYFFLLPIISPLFFPAKDHVTSFLLAFSMFFVGFIARPLGAIIFGYIGDKKGRRLALSLSLLGMALSTMLIAFLPTYFHAGLWATTGLVILRIFHGLSIGSEFIGSLVFLSEHVERKQGPFYTACLISSTILGWFIGSACSFLTIHYDFSWRIPFMLGALTGVLGFLIRHYTDEALVFMKITTNRQTFTKSFLARYSLQVFTVFGAGGLIGAFFYGVFIFPNTYLPEFIGVPYTVAVKSTSIGIGLYMLFLPFMGWLAIRITPFFLMVSCAFLTSILAYPIFLLLSLGCFPFLVLAQSIAALLLAGFIAPASFIIVQIFPIEVRYTLTSVSYNLGVCLLGGIFPLIAVALINHTNSLSIPSLYLACCACLALAGNVLLFIKKLNIEEDERSFLTCS